MYLTESLLKKLAKISGISLEEIKKQFGSGEIYAYTIKPIVILNNVENFQENPFMDVPPEKTDKSYRYVLQLHFRGASVHGDLRLERQSDLIGWTMLIQLKGYPDKPITTLKDAKEFYSKHKSDGFKINLETGEFKQRQDKAGRYRKAEIQVVKKAIEPHVWLFNENLIPINQFDYLYFVEGVAPIGSPGSTADYPGVFLIVDKGYVEYGATKPYFYEYFFNSGKLRGRYVIRTLSHMSENKILPPAKVPEGNEIRSAHFWVMVQPDDQRPYVITERAIKTNYIPPYGFSALPYKIRRNVPQQYQYWKFKDKNKRLEIRKQLVENVEELDIDIDKLIKMSEESNDFGIWRIWWKRTNKEGKPVVVVRYGPSTQYYLLKIGDRVFESGYNPFQTYTFLYPRHIKDDLLKYKSKTRLQPGTELNPTKSTTANIEPFKISKVKILENSPSFIKFELNNDLYMIYKPEGESFWLFEKSENPSVK